MSRIANNDNLLRLQSLDPATKLHAYKVFAVDKHGRGRPPVYGSSLRYRLRKGGVIKQDACNSDPNADCGIGLHACTMEWACDFWHDYERHDHYMPLQIWKIEFGPLDIGCVPTEPTAASSGTLDSITTKAMGKFRLRQFKLVKRVRWGKSNP